MSRHAGVDEGPSTTPGDEPRGVPAWPMQILAVAVCLRAILYWSAILSGYWTARVDPIIPTSAQIGQAFLIALVGAILLTLGRRDRRAWFLGVFLLDASCTLLDVLVVDYRGKVAWVTLATHIRTDAFQAAMLWFFASEFPQPTSRPGLAAAFRIAIWGTVALGVCLVVFDALAEGPLSASTGTLATLAHALQRDARGGGSDWYFSLQFLTFVPLVIAFALKSREHGPDARRRLQWFAMGIVASLLPLVLDVLLTTVVPAYEEQTSGAMWRARGFVILAGFVALPLLTAYAALVEHILDVRIVVGTALQYLLARYAVLAMAVAPVLGVVYLVATNRSLPVIDLLAGPRGLWLSVLTGVGLLGAIVRTRLLGLVDRVFFREKFDAQAALVAVARLAHDVSDVASLTDHVEGQIADALHPSSIGTAIADGDGHLHKQHGDPRPLAAASALAQLVGSTDEPLDVGPSNDLVRRLPAPDRAWLAESHAHLAVPFRASGTLLGVLLLGPKKSELAYDKADRSLLQSVGSAAGLALDRLRRTPPPQPTDLPPAAWECVECGRVSGSRIVECACGGLVQRASVPESLDGRLRFISRIGVGGMGQVYKAVDVRLGQVRAVKTLSSVDAAVSGRLRREARKMAAVEHANLAHVHGVEMWGSVPMLVMECLEGGTLAERLRRRPLEPARMLALGVQIGLALDALHRAGMLHRDVKPSNIGFTRDAVPKLMDFGLATAMPGWALPGAGPTDSTLSATTSSHGLRGTPGYVSPAVLRGREPSPADDIWSLSVTLYESVIGRNPFQGPTVAATAANVLAHTSLDVNRSLPWPVAELFVELLSPDEQGRPSAAADFVSRVEGVQREGGFNHGQEVESEETRR